MNLEQMKKEIESLGKTPAAEKMYPITSEWVPVTDVLAIINRFEKHWKNMTGPDESRKHWENESPGVLPLKTRFRNILFEKRME
jgi:hypothetical protein